MEVVGDPTLRNLPHNTQQRLASAFELALEFFAVVGMHKGPCMSVPATKRTIKVKGEAALEKHIVNAIT